MIETHEHTAISKSRSVERDKKLPPSSKIKMNRIAYAVVHISAFAVWGEAGGVLDVNTQRANVIVIQSTWRRVKKERIKVGDLQPVKDVKGGGGVTGQSKPITGRTDTTGSYLIRKGHYRVRDTSKWNFLIGHLSATFKWRPISAGSKRCVISQEA